MPLTVCYTTGDAKLHGLTFLFSHFLTGGQRKFPNFCLLTSATKSLNNFSYRNKLLNSILEQIYALEVGEKSVVHSWTRGRHVKNFQPLLFVVGKPRDGTKKKEVGNEMLCVCVCVWYMCVTSGLTASHPPRIFPDVVLDLCQIIFPSPIWSLSLGSSVLFKCRVGCSHLLAVPRVRQQDVSRLFMSLRFPLSCVRCVFCCLVVV